MNRRKFLSLMTAGVAAGVSGVLPSSEAQAAGGEFPGYPDSNAVLTDLTKCIGCRKCEEACARVNDLPAPPSLENKSVFDEKRRPHADSFTVVNKYTVDGVDIFRKVQCMHCLEPACATACFVKAFTKNPDGSVTYDPTYCVGCRYCMVSCPFNIPAYDYNKVADPQIHKCTMCHARQLEGKIPGCVEACPTGALIFGKRDDLIAIARKRIDDHPGRYINHIYGEHEMGGTSWLTISGIDFSQVGMREDLGTKIAAEYTTGVLGALPMVVGFWPVVLGGAYYMTKRKDEIAKEEREQAVAAAVEAERARGEAAAAKALDKAKKDAQKDKDRAIEAAKKEVREQIMAEVEAKQNAAAEAGNEGENDGRA
ncbi:MAG: 4Fe-4S dicluster domain-containing protein [Mailhella sp.]|nr:4Fe-4S dicluster domain-containing protein [Mailhella sp.]